MIENDANVESVPESKYVFLYIINLSIIQLRN